MRRAAHRVPEPALGRGFPHSPRAGRIGRAGRGGGGPRSSRGWSGTEQAGGVLDAPAAGCCATSAATWPTRPCSCSARPRRCTPRCTRGPSGFDDRFFLSGQAARVTSHLRGRARPCTAPRAADPGNRPHRHLRRRVRRRPVRAAARREDGGGRPVRHYPEASLGPDLPRRGCPARTRPGSEGQLEQLLLRLRPRRAGRGPAAGGPAGRGGRARGPGRRPGQRRPRRGRAAQPSGITSTSATGTSGPACARPTLRQPHAPNACCAAAAAGSTVSVARSSGRPARISVVQVPPDALPPPGRAYQQVDNCEGPPLVLGGDLLVPAAAWSAPATTTWTAAAASRPRIRPGSRRCGPRQGRNRAAAAGRRGSSSRLVRRVGAPRRAARGTLPRARPPAGRRATGR